MILVGNRRGGATELAAHLLNVRDNDHVYLHEIRGFMSDELEGALHEAYGISRGTRCKKFLYSLSLSPPKLEDVSIEAFETAIEKIERLLGFTGQPRAIVFHEKNGRRHAHVVWSRINAATMTAIDPYLDKQTLSHLLWINFTSASPDFSVSLYLILSRSADCVAVFISSNSSSIWLNTLSKFVMERS